MNNYFLFLSLCKIDCWVPGELICFLNELCFTKYNQISFLKSRRIIRHITFHLIDIWYFSISHLVLYLQVENGLIRSIITRFYQSLEYQHEYIVSILVISSVQKCLSVDNLITYGFYCWKLLHVSIIKILDSMLSNCLFPIFHLISKMCLFHGVFWHILYRFVFFRKITTLREILCDVVNR